MKSLEIHNVSKPPLKNFGFKEKDQFYWWASWYADVLGYKSLKTFKPAILRAKKACNQLGINTESNFIKELHEKKQDVKLSKFACFMISLHADSRKPIVRRARSYFLDELGEVNQSFSMQNYLTRRLEREAMKQLHLQLKGVAIRSHVKDFQYFMNEGYIGMYNQTMSELKTLKGLTNKEDMFDFMSMNELAANNLRITLTIERLKRLRNPSEYVAGKIHWKVGAELRALVQRNTGSYPEYLAMAKNLNKLKVQLESVQKFLNQNGNIKALAS